MAKRYVEANALIQDIKQSKANNNHNNSIASQTHNAEHKKFIKMVLDQPTADVVEVVRCKNCQYWHSPTNDDMHYCKLRFGLQGIVAESDFCSYGKRRSDEK